MINWLLEELSQRRESEKQLADFPERGSPNSEMIEMLQQGLMGYNCEYHYAILSYRVRICYRLANLVLNSAAICLKK